MKNKDLNSKYWKKLIENDLGEKKTSSLFMNSIEGIDILPYYTENNCYNNDFIFPDEWNILGEIKFINKKGEESSSYKKMPPLERELQKIVDEETKEEA